MTRESAIEVIKKLKTLAEKSTGAESERAREKLQSYCLKYNIDPDDYSVDEYDASMSFSNEQERMLLSNIVSMIMKSNQVKGRIKNNAMHFRCTLKQLQDIKDAFSHYKKIYYDYVDAVLVAIVSKNQITNTSTEQNKNFEYEFMTDEERREYEEIKKSLDAHVKKDSDQVPQEENILDEDKIKQNERIEKLMMVMDENKWKPLKKLGLFLN